MSDIKELLKKDRFGIPYIDSRDVDIRPFTFSTDIKKNYDEKRTFYHIDGIDNYIIKDTKDIPIILNVLRNKIMLKKLINKQDKILNTDFPIGYYQSYGNFKGMIIPHYDGGMPLKYLTNLRTFRDIINYYHHDDNEVSNLVDLCLNILSLIEEMFDENVFYMDVNYGNFLIYNNDIKVIDFEPDYIYVNNHKNRYQKYILRNYAELVNIVWKRLGFYDINFDEGENFDETQEKVKLLVKERRR